MKKNVTPEEFVKAWQSSECLNEVKEKTGLTISNITARATYYRKCGVILKYFRKRLDVAKLNKLCK